MRKAFLEFLATEEMVPPERLDHIQSLLRGMPEQIGSIAFGYGMITGRGIDEILDEQRKHYRPFGEIAISKGLLTREQVETLLAVQRMRAATETAETLVLSGICTIEQVARQLSRYLSESQHPIPCAES
ncbi:MAG: hypothetical protein ACE5I3_05350 [Phycisphaerae bacterium]